MADDLIHCPSCNFRLRLPPDLYGTEVECPQCRKRFTAPMPQAGAALRPPPGREYDAVAPMAAPPDVSSRVIAPAVALLVGSLLGLWIYGQSLFSFMQLQNNPAEWDKVKQEALKHQNIKPEDQKNVDHIMDAMRDYGAPVCGILTALNLVTAVGAVQMLRRRTYGLALLGSIVALNPTNVACCILQVPFGLWGLIVLMNGDVKRSFR